METNVKVILKRLLKEEELNVLHDSESAYLSYPQKRRTEIDYYLALEIIKYDFVELSSGCFETNEENFFVSNEIKHTNIKMFFNILSKQYFKNLWNG